MRDVAECDNDTNATEQMQLMFQIGPAGIELILRGSIARRRTAHGSRNVAIAEYQAIVSRFRLGLTREPEAMERFVQPGAARVAGEHPTGAIRTVRGRRQAHDQESASRVAEARNGFAPVVQVAKCPLLDVRDVFPVRN